MAQKHRWNEMLLKHLLSINIKLILATFGHHTLAEFPQPNITHDSVKTLGKNVHAWLKKKQSRGARKDVMAMAVIAMTWISQISFTAAHFLRGR